jgi:pimeloyl-ACP methyl ester carboxylesterase
MKLHIHESGSPGSPAVLFLHGSPLSGRMWQPQLEGLLEFHCLAPDLPGHGKSADVPLHMPDLVEELIETIARRVPSGKTHLVGLSFGGVVAQALMVKAPHMLDRVVLSGTSTRMSRLLVAMSQLNEPILRLMRPEQVAALVCMQFGIPAQHRKNMSEDFARFSPKTLTKVLQTYLDIEMPAEFPSPVLVAMGGKETFYAKRAARALANGIPQAKGFCVPGCGHVWNLEAPDLFNRVLRAWLKGACLPEELQPLVS